MSRTASTILTLCLAIAIVVVAPGALLAHAADPVPTCGVVTDPIGDAVGGSAPAGDLTTMQFSCSQFAAGGMLSVYTAQYTDPTTSPAWTQFGSTVTWDIDVNRDGVADERATFHGGAQPTADVRRISDNNLICSLTPVWGIGYYDTPNQGAGYGVQVPSYCILDAQVTGVTASITYHASATSTQTDSAPNSGPMTSGHASIHATAFPILVSRAQWYNSPTRTADQANYFGNPGDIAINTSGGILYPAGPSVPYFATRKAVLRAATGAPRFYRQYRQGNPSTPTATEFVATFQFGNTGDIPVSGDWNADGVDTLGLFRPSTGQWFLTNDPQFSNQPSAPLIVLSFGSPGDIPVAGDWTGSGMETPAVFRQGRWFFLASLHSGAADSTVLYGNPGDTPIPGDWTGQPITTVGIWRSGRYYLAGNNTTPKAVAFYDGGVRGDQFPRPQFIY